MITSLLLLAMSLNITQVDLAGSPDVRLLAGSPNVRIKPLELADSPHVRIKPIQLIS